MYNRVVRFTVLVALLVGLAACSKNIENKDAVRQGVMDYIKAKGLAQMDIDVTSVAFKGNEAEAMVDFRAKGGAAGSGIQIKYTLEKKGDKWAVKGRSDSAGAPHGGAMDPSGAMPGGMPGGMPAGGGALPQGHPSPGEGAQKK